jgi:hypothetical protein
MTTIDLENFDDKWESLNPKERFQLIPHVLTKIREEINADVKEIKSSRKRLAKYRKSIPRLIIIRLITASIALGGASFVLHNQGNVFMSNFLMNISGGFFTAMIIFASFDTVREKAELVLNESEELANLRTQYVRERYKFLKLCQQYYGRFEMLDETAIAELASNQEDELDMLYVAIKDAREKTKAKQRLVLIKGQKFLKKWK